MENNVCVACNSDTLEYSDDNEVACTTCGYYKMELVNYANSDYCQQINEKQEYDKVLEEFTKVALTFDLTSEERVKSYEIFQNNFKDGILRKKSRSIAYGCCIFIGANGKLQMKDVLKYLNCSWKEFNTMYVKIKERPQSEPANYKDLVTTILNNIDFGSQKDEIIDITYKLLEICNDNWLLTGKSIESMVHTICYYAWKSLNIKSKNLNFSYFRKILPIRNVYKNNKEFENFIIEFGNYLPWIKKSEINNKNLHFYLKDIISHSEYLKGEIIKKELASNSSGKSSSVSESIYKKFRSLNIKQTIKDRPVEENYNEDFSDSEIDQYIRSTKEIELLSAKN